MPKVTLTTLTAGRSSVDLLNSNFSIIQSAFDSCLFLDGTAPNSMNTSLGMNSNRIINLADGINPQDAITVNQFTNSLLASASVPWIGPTAPAGVDGLFWLDTSGASMILYLYAEGTWIDVTSEAGMSAAEIKTLYESNLNTNVFTDSQVVDVAAGVTHRAAANPHTGSAALGANSDITSLSGTTMLLDPSVALGIATKQYVDNAAAGLLDYKGGYAASTNTPNLDSTPVGVLVGDTYTVTDTGTFFTEVLEAGDILVAEVDDPTVLADWTVINKNLPYTPVNLAGDTMTGLLVLSADPTAALGAATKQFVEETAISMSVALGAE